MRFLLPVALATALLTYSAEAQTSVATGSVAIGAGTRSCGTWTAARHDKQSLQAQVDAVDDSAWVLGFLSGIGNDAWIRLPSGDAVDPLRGTDRDGVLAWIDNYCQAHPLEKIFTAAWAFVHAHPR
jgi:hypothetical protein